MAKIFRTLPIFESLLLLLVFVLWFGYPTGEAEIAHEPPPAVEVTKTVNETSIDLPSRSETAIAEPRWTNLGEFTLTAYCSCSKCCGKWAYNRPKDEFGNDIVYTSTGVIAKAGRTIAVDPNVIPYGSKVKIGDTVYVAEDCGGAIKGNDIDVYHDNHQKALEFGRQKQEVYILVGE